MTSKKEDLERKLRVFDRLGYAIAAAYLVYFAWRTGPGFFDPYFQNDDVRAVFFPLWGYHGPWFEEDHLARIMGSLTPWFYRLIAWVATLFIDVLTLPKVFQLVAVVWGAVHVHRMGHRRAGVWGGVFGLFVLLHAYDFLLRTSGGLPRAFAMPALLATADGIDSKNERLAGAGPVLAVLFYPPAGLLALGTYLLWVAMKVYESRGDRTGLRARLLHAGAVIVLCAVAGAPSVWEQRDFGRPYSLREARGMPEFSVDGRVNIVPQPSVIVQSGRVFQSTWRAAGDGPLRILERASDATRGGPMMVAIIAIAFLIAMRKLPVPSASLLLLVSGYVWFGLASLLAFRLYSPDRMLLNSLPAAAVVFLVTTVPSIGTSEGKPWAGKRSAALGMAGGCLLFGIAHGGPVGFSVDANEKRELFEILETLPEQALIAGHPARLDDVPLWSKRRVLISYEMHGPWFRKIWEEGKRRTYASLEACYAVDVEPLVTLREEYGVDFMLLRREDLGLEFALEAGYFEPFGAFIEELTVAPANELIWNRASDETIVDEASGYVLFDLEAVIVESRVGEE